MNAICTFTLKQIYGMNLVHDQIVKQCYNILYVLHYQVYERECQRIYTCKNITNLKEKYVGHICRWLTGSRHGPLARCVKLRVAHAPGMPGIFSPTLRVNDPDMRRGACMTHVPRCMPGSLNNGYLWRRRRGKRFRHSRRMRNQQFYVSGKRPMVIFSAVT